MANPYESPYVGDVNFDTEERHPKQPLPGQNPLAARAIWWLALIAWFYPAFLLAAIYGTWLMAWLVLGHMPRPSLDDPKYISIAVGIPYVLAGLLIVGFPAAAVAGVVLQLFVAQRSWLRRFLWSTTSVVIWISIIALLRWDPLLVGQWYMD